MKNVPWRFSNTLSVMKGGSELRYVKNALNTDTEAAAFHAMTVETSGRNANTLYILTYCIKSPWGIL